MYMRPKAEHYFRGEMFVNLKISTITGVFYCFTLLASKQFFVSFGLKIVKIDFFYPFIVCGGHYKPSGSGHADFHRLN